MVVVFASTRDKEAHAKIVEVVVYVYKRRKSRCKDCGSKNRNKVAEIVIAKKPKVAEKAKLDKLTKE